MPTSWPSVRPAFGGCSARRDSCRSGTANRRRRARVFAQPLVAHQHWHLDVFYLNIGGMFYYLCSILVLLSNSTRCCSGDLDRFIREGVLENPPVSPHAHLLRGGLEVVHGAIPGQFRDLPRPAASHPCYHFQA